MNSKSIGLSVNISTIAGILLVPSSRSVLNQLDFIGDMLSTPRIPNERNVDYRNRLFDVNVHKGSPLYEGVINNMAREFGYIRQKAIQIDLRTDSAGNNIAESPRVDILANRVVLYKSWSNKQTYEIDREIEFYSKTSDGFYLDDLVDAINESTYFYASIYSGIRENMHSFLLVRGSSDVLVFNELIQPDTRTKLAYENVVRGSLWFDEKDVFETEVEADPEAEGEYYVDYVNGLITSYSIPSGKYGCGYRAASFPMKVDYLPIQIFTLNDDDFRGELFLQEELDSGDTTDGLLNSEGAEIFHQLFKETRFFWGE